MGDVIGEEKMVNFQAEFSLFEKTRLTSCITVEELTAVIRSLAQNPTEEKLQDLMKEVDSDCNGAIEMSRNLTLMARTLKENDAEDELKEAFKVFDKDQNGYISAGELRNVMISLVEKLTDEEAEQMIKEADLDGDGRVNYDDFVKMMRDI